MLRLILLFLIGCSGLTASATACPERTASHAVTVKHPGLKEEVLFQYPLTEVLANDCSPNYFYTDVESVICGSEVCQVVPVRLFWDRLGQFTNFHLAEHIELEKEAGEPFNNEDYQQLRNILRDKSSPLHDYFKEGLVGAVDNNAADALSGATITINPPDAVIDGAVWTCYTLWHWANGDIAAYIHHVTAMRSSDALLRNYLSYGANDYRQFALKTLTERRVGDATTRKAILAAALARPRLVHYGMDYAAILPTEEYRAFMLSFISQGTGYSKLVGLERLKEADIILDQALLLDLSKELTIGASYQEVDLLLRIFERADTLNSQIKQAILGLLGHTDFLTARRAFYFLNNQSLSPEEEERLQRFSKSHAGRL